MKFICIASPKTVMELHTGVLLLLLCLMAQFGSISMAKCSAEEGMSASGSDDQQILLDGKVSLMANEIDGITLEACCTACDEWIGSTPCGGYVYNTTSQRCIIKANLGTLTSDPGTDLVIGYPATQNYALKYVDEQPQMFMAMQTFESMDVKECAFNCLVVSECAAFQHNYTSNQCKIGKVYMSGGIEQLDTAAGTNFYEIEHNTDESTAPAVTPILIIGGEDAAGVSDKIYELIPEIPLIQQVGSLPTPLKNFGAHVLNNKLVIVGGTDATGLINRWSMSYQETMPFQLGPNDGPWNSALTAYPCTHVFKYEIYTIVGTDSFGNPTSAATKIEPNFVQYSILNAITSIPGAAEGISETACVGHGNTLYSIGGKNRNGIIMNVLWSYNLESGYVMDIVESGPTSMKLASAVWYQGKIVVCGGMTYETPMTVINVCHTFEPVGKQWDSMASMVNQRYGHKLVNWGDDKILAIGGSNDTANLDTIEVYDNGAWSVFGAQLPDGITGMQAINLDNPN